MHSAQVNYVDENSLLVINPAGKMRQLFVPFRVQLLMDTSRFKKNTWVFVEAIKADDQFTLLYGICGYYYPYFFFRVKVTF